MVIVTEKMIHPNGVIFIPLNKGTIIQLPDYYTHVCEVDGVWIEYPDGVKRFISNSWYE